MNQLLDVPSLETNRYTKIQALATNIAINIVADQAITSQLVEQNFNITALSVEQRNEIEKVINTPVDSDFYLLLNYIPSFKHIYKISELPTDLLSKAIELQMAQAFLHPSYEILDLVPHNTDITSILWIMTKEIHLQFLDKINGLGAKFQEGFEPINLKNILLQVEQIRPGTSDFLNDTSKLVINTDSDIINAWKFLKSLGLDPQIFFSDEQKYLDLLPSQDYQINQWMGKIENGEYHYFEIMKHFKLISIEQVEFIEKIFSLKQSLSLSEFQGIVDDINNHKVDGLYPNIDSNFFSKVIKKYKFNFSPEFLDDCTKQIAYPDGTLRLETKKQLFLIESLNDTQPQRDVLNEVTLESLIVSLENLDISKFPENGYIERVSKVLMSDQIKLETGFLGKLIDQIYISGKSIDLSSKKNWLLFRLLVKIRPDRAFHISVGAMNKATPRSIWQDGETLLMERAQRLELILSLFPSETVDRFHYKILQTSQGVEFIAFVLKENPRELNNMLALLKDLQKQGKDIEEILKGDGYPKQSFKQLWEANKLGLNSASSYEFFCSLNQEQKDKFALVLNQLRERILTGGRYNSFNSSEQIRRFFVTRLKEEFGENISQDAISKLEVDFNQFIFSTFGVSQNNRYISESSPKTMLEFGKQIASSRKEYSPLPVEVLTPFKMNFVNILLNDKLNNVIINNGLFKMKTELKNILKQLQFDDNKIDEVFVEAFKKVEENSLNLSRLSTVEQYKLLEAWLETLQTNIPDTLFNFGIGENVTEFLISLDVLKENIQNEMSKFEIKNDGRHQVVEIVPAIPEFVGLGMLSSDLCTATPDNTFLINPNYKSPHSKKEYTQILQAGDFWLTNPSPEKDGSARYIGECRYSIIELNDKSVDKLQGEDKLAELKNPTQTEKKKILVINHLNLTPQEDQKLYDADQFVLSVFMQLYQVAKAAKMDMYFVDSYSIFSNRPKLLNAMKKLANNSSKIELVNPLRTSVQVHYETAEIYQFQNYT